jgi:exopolysaccharide production protein ExoZ
MLFVFMGHFGTVWTQLTHPTGLAHSFLRIVEADATFGSSFFMLISAFFGYSSLRRGKKPFGEFLRGRLLRIYPLYIAMTGVYIVGSIAFPKMSKLPADVHQLPAFLFETLLFLPGLLPIRPLMDVAWTLGFIILFYFIGGAFAAIFKRWEVSRAFRFALFSSLAILWAVAGDCNQWWEPRTAILWTGMALSEAMEGIGSERLHRAQHLVAPAVLIAVMGVWARTHLLLSQTSAPLLSRRVWTFVITSVTLSAFVWVCSFGAQWWKRLLSGSELRQLGAASYSFYLTHGLVLKLFRFGIIPLLGVNANTATSFWASQLVGLVLSIWTAKLVHQWIESPMSRFIHEKTAKATSASCATQTPSRARSLAAASAS